MDSLQQQEYAEKRKIVDEILREMNEKEAAIKQGELEEQELQEAIEQLQKRQKERIDETKKQREELSLLRRRLHPAFSECRKARAKAKPRFFWQFYCKNSEQIYAANYNQKVIIQKMVIFSRFKICMAHYEWN